MAKIRMVDCALPDLPDLHIDEEQIRRVSVEPLNQIQELRDPIFEWCTRGFFWSVCRIVPFAASEQVTNIRQAAT